MSALSDSMTARSPARITRPTHKRLKLHHLRRHQVTSPLSVGHLTPVSGPTRNENSTLCQEGSRVWAPYNATTLPRTVSPTRALSISFPRKMRYSDFKQATPFLWYCVLVFAMGDLVFGLYVSP